MGRQPLAESGRPPRSPASATPRWSRTASTTSSSPAPTCSAFTPPTWRSSSPACSPIATAWTQPPPRSSTTGAGSLSAPAAALTRTTTISFPPLTAAGGDLQAFGREIESCVNPMWLLTRLPNNVLCYVGIRHGFKGTNACITNQCVGGALAVAEAAAAIRAGEADRAVAVGHDAPIEPETLLYYHQARPAGPGCVAPLRPQPHRHDLRRGRRRRRAREGSRMRRRGRLACCGEFLGSGCTTEATGIVEVRPDGDGLSRAIELALADARSATGPGGHGGGPWQRHPGFGRVRGDGHPPGLW